LRQLARRSATRESVPLGALLLVAASLLAWLAIGPWVEYGHQGLLMIPFFMLALQVLSQPGDSLPDRALAAMAALPVLINAGLLNSSDMAKSFTVMTVLFVLLMAAGAASRVPQVGYRMPRRLWLAWYPAHFAVIAVLLHWPGP
ncbi:MAG: TraX family protein, partial [Halomonas sp.]|nr:TraX family protein [Halomonas sp.]